MPEKFEQTKKPAQPDILESIQSWALKTELDNKQKNYLDQLVAQLNKILSGRTVPQMVKQKDLTGLQQYLDLVKALKMLLKEKKFPAEIADQFFQRECLDFYQEIMQDAESNRVKIRERILTSMAGMSDDQAWQLRDEIFDDDSVDLKYFFQSLTAIDSDKAWEMRDFFLEQGLSVSDILQSLAGLDSERAWNMRKDIFKKYGLQEELLLSLAGVDSERAWNYRHHLALNTGDALKFGAVIRGLAGLDTEQAWQIRNQLSSTLFKKEHFHSRELMVDSILGLESIQAWNIRREFINHDYQDEALLTLATLDTDQAWQMRDEILKSLKFKHRNYLLSLAGVGSTKAWHVRKQAKKKKAVVSFLPLCCYGDHKVAVVRRAKMENK